MFLQPKENKANHPKENLFNPDLVSAFKAWCTLLVSRKSSDVERAGSTVLTCPLTNSDRKVLIARQNGYDWYRFPESGILRVDLTRGLADEVDFQEEFADLYVDTYERKFDKKMQRSIKRAKYLKSITSGRTLVDVGSNVGIFCEACHREGFDPVGIEISQPLFDHARKRFPHLSFVNQPLETCAEERQFDVVYCAEVIEHTLDPAAFARSLRQLLKPGGVLFLTTPAASQYLEFGKPFTDLSAPDHKVYFDRDSIIPFLEAAGFTDVRFRPGLNPKWKRFTPRFRPGLNVIARG